MARKLPPLNALRAFEATARWRNFTRAAQELGVTQGAVSKQIGILEDHLSVRLFERNGRQIVLSPEGEAYLASVSAAFEAISLATDQIAACHGRRELLTVSVLPSLSSRWLIPLLEGFRRRHAGIGVRVVIGDGPVDFATLNADIAIRVARRNDWKRLYAEPIMGEELIPVCSPALLALQPIRRAADFTNHVLLQHTCRPDMWLEYLKAMGAKAPIIKHDLGFEHFFMLTQAAIDGLGMALIPRFMITRERLSRWSS